MLLSDDKVSRYLQDHFVLVWNSIRPAPKVTIDFGDGHVLERTLKGNTCFYVINPDGKVVDALPGVYRPDAFLAELSESLTLVDLSDAEIRERHRQVAEWGTGVSSDSTLSKMPVQGPLIRALEPTTVSKSALQSPMLQPLGAEPTRSAADIIDMSALPMSTDEIDAYLPGEGDLGERALRADSAASVAVLRPAVHQWFAQLGALPTPQECRTPIYKEILKVDLKDPYMGLKVEGIPGTD